MPRQISIGSLSSSSARREKKGGGVVILNSGADQGPIESHLAVFLDVNQLETDCPPTPLIRFLL
jgi:hypothetical protein